MADLNRDNINPDALPPSGGTKVTTDPASKQPISEGTGIITSDSLAGESIASGGAFSTKNPEAGRFDQPSYSTTTNNTSISGATILDSAPDAEAREATEAWDESATLNHGRELGKDAGRGPTYNAGAAANVDPAPTYAGDPYADPSKQKPHGKNIHEGGFDSDAPNASFTTDIGSKNDPGRIAEKKFQGYDAQTGLDAGHARDTSAVKGEGIYDALNAEEQAPDTSNV